MRIVVKNMIRVLLQHICEKPWRRSLPLIHAHEDPYWKNRLYMLQQRNESLTNDDSLCNFFSS